MVIDQWQPIRLQACVHARRQYFEQRLNLIEMLLVHAARCQFFDVSTFLVRLGLYPISNVENAFAALPLFIAICLITNFMFCNGVYSGKVKNVYFIWWQTHSGQLYSKFIRVRQVLQKI